MPIIECNDKGTFDRELKNAKSKLVVIDFHATWCGPCKMIAPKYAEFSEKYKQSCVFLKVDVDKNREAAQECKVEAMPTFAFFHELRMIDAVKGADPGKLETLIKKYSEQYSKYAFKGPGNVLGASGSTAKVEPAKPAAGAAASAPPRRNPWADPNFFPKSSASSAPTTTTAAAKPTTTSNPAADKWANKDLSKPSTPAAAAAPAPTLAATTASKPAPAASTPSPAAAPAAATPAPSATPAAATAPSATSSPAPPSAAPAATPASTGHDPRLTVNAVLLQQLVDMGFSQIRSQKALILTKNTSVENAMNWLLEHEGDADIDEPLQVVGTQSNIKGAPLGVQDDAAILSNPDLDEEEKRILLAAKANAAAKPATAMSAPVASGEKKVSEMTSEEKMQWLAKKREERKIRLEKESFEKARTSERSRVAINKAAGDMKEKIEEEAAKAAYAKKKKEEKEKAEARKRIKEKLAQDKARRQKEQEELMAKLAAEKAAAAAKK